MHLLAVTDTPDIEHWQPHSGVKSLVLELTFGQYNIQILKGTDYYYSTLHRGYLIQSPCSTRPKIAVIECKDVAPSDRLNAYSHTQRRILG